MASRGEGGWAPPPRAVLPLLLLCRWYRPCRRAGLGRRRRWRRLCVNGGCESRVFVFSCFRVIVFCVLCCVLYTVLIVLFRHARQTNKKQKKTKKQKKDKGQRHASCSTRRAPSPLSCILSGPPTTRGTPPIRALEKGRSKKEILEGVRSPATTLSWLARPHERVFICFSQVSGLLGRQNNTAAVLL